MSFKFSLIGLVISEKASGTRGEINNHHSVISWKVYFKGEKIWALGGFSPIEQEFVYTFSMGFWWQIREITLDSVGGSGGDLK